MDWITLSLISLVAMSFMVILITGQMKKGVSSQFVMVIISIVWLLGYGFWLWLEGIDFTISEITLAIILISGIIGVFANWLLFEAAASAPNPGFSFAISNANPVLIAIMAVIFLGSELTWEQFVGVLIIVIGVVIINIFSENKRGNKGKKWIIQSLIALLLSSLLAILIIWLIKEGISTVFILLLLAIIYIIFYSFWTYKKGINFSISNWTIIALIGAGIFSVIGNWTILEAAAIASNPGFAFAISGSKPALIAILAVFILKSELKLVQLVGVVLSIIGIVVIVL